MISTNPFRWSCQNFYVNLFWKQTFIVNIKVQRVFAAAVVWFFSYYPLMGAILINNFNGFLCPFRDYHFKRNRRMHNTNV